MIAVFFGGRSCEHDISIITGLQALSACPRQCVGVYIDERGEWWTGEFDSVNAVKNKRFKGKSVHIRPAQPYLYCRNKRLCKIDAALLCMHGILGEDGALQGLLAMCGIPYTGSDVLASALGMNKLFAKRMFEAAGLNVLPYRAVTRQRYERDTHAVLEELVSGLGFPMIVKPCNLGSSIGISVADDNTALYTALRVAFEWDDTVVVERALVDFTEVNCAVLGEGGDVTVSDTEQPVGWKSFLTFADKYSGDVKHSGHKIPAEIDEATRETVERAAVTAFDAIGGSGVARVDFLVKDEVYVNEINTIPGSLACTLFRRDMDFSKLIERLIDYAFRRSARFERLKRLYTPPKPIIGAK